VLYDTFTNKAQTMQRSRFCLNTRAVTPRSVSHIFKPH